MATQVLLGNQAPIHKIGDLWVPIDGINQAVTTINLWEGIDDPEVNKLALSTNNSRELINRSRALADDRKHYAIALHEIEDLWPRHSTVGPAWVRSSDPDLQKALADYYGCMEGEPVAVITNAGRDALHLARWGTTTAPAQFSALGISTNNGSGFVAADTTLASELTTNGLTRGVATYAHTTGATTSTLTKTWTYTTTGSVVIASVATFNNASSGGTLGEEDALSSTITVATSGDTATVTYTATTS